MIVHSKIIGEGFPFIILHGFLGMGDNWKTLGSQFASLGYQVHLVDQRNHGRSFHDPEFDYEIMAEDLKIYCDAHHIDETILLGHSMGGKTAMFFATTYPEKVAKLIIADIAPRAYAAHHEHILSSLEALYKNIHTLKTRKEADNFLSNHIVETGIRQFLLKNLFWQKPGLLGLRINLPVLIVRYAAIGVALPEDRYYTGPTLFLKGERSNYIQQTDDFEISKAFAKAYVHTIKRAGHWLHAENPKDFYKEVLNFL